MASVIIPAKNEAASLPRTLQALVAQAGIDKAQFEVLLLINNSTDDSWTVAQQFRQAHPELVLYALCRDFPADCAFIGPVRQLLMNTACRRLLASTASEKLILSTDADTEVAADWIAQNLRAIRNGAGAVGGLIQLRASELDRLPPRTREMRILDDRYRTLVTWLEDRCDPLPYDPWPRHYHHFGGSLAVTPEVYQQVGGLPPERKLEDVAFYQRLLLHDVPFRHSPQVVVHTSARLRGRTDVGLAEQLAVWNHSTLEPGRAPVPAVDGLRKRFLTRCAFRSRHHDKPFGAAWQQYEETLPPLATEPLATAIAALESEFVVSKHCDAIRAYREYGP